MNATPPPQLLNWAEALGELIGRSIVNQLRSRTALGALFDGRAPAAPRSRAAATVAARPLAPATIGPRRRGRPPGSKNKPRDPSAAAAPRAPRRRREKESVEGFVAGSTVDFRFGNRRGTGSILTVDEDKGQLRVLDLGTEEVHDLLPSQVRVASAPKVVFRRRSATAPQETEQPETASAAGTGSEADASGEPAPQPAEEAAPNAWAQAINAVAAANESAAAAPSEETDVGSAPASEEPPTESSGG